MKYDLELWLEGIFCFNPFLSTPPPPQLYAVNLNIFLFTSLEGRNHQDSYPQEFRGFGTNLK